MIKKTFLAAAIQFNPELNKWRENINSLLEVVSEAAQQGAKLIVTPEMATTGYNYENRKAIEPFVDSIPGQTTELFMEVAKRYKTYIVIGMPEVDKKTDIYYNSAFLVGPEGYIGKYRKTHLWETEEHWAAWGDMGVPVFNTGIGKIAINICMDSVYFEAARLAALKGADILAFLTNSSVQSIWMLQARAQQNGFYIVSANRSNTDLSHHMVGASAVWSPEGEKLAEAEYVPTEADDIDESTIIYSQIDPAKYDNQAKRRLTDRKPEAYKELMLYIPFGDRTENKDSRNIKAAALQYEPIIGNKEKNMNKIKKLITKIAAENEGLDLVLLPELSTTGSIKSLTKAEKSAESMDGSTVKKFKKLALENNLHIIFGMIEREEDKLYNSAVLLNSQGRIAGKYRKIHLNNEDENWAEPGGEVKVFSTKELGRIGIMIGDDVSFPETAGVMAVKRADIIAIPSSWYGEYGSEIKANQEMPTNKYPQGAMSLWDSTVLSAQSYTLVANFIGTENNYLGRSALYTLDPLYGLDQPQIASEDKEEALVVNFTTVQTDWWFNQEKLIQSRRTHLYKALVY